MRSIIASAALGLSTLTLVAVPASANWSCGGPAYVCGGGHAAKAYKKSAYKGYGKKVAYRGYGKKVAYKGYGKKVAYGSKRKSYSGGSYGGGGGGMASYYWQGSQTASGQRFNPDGLTAAHRSLPFGTRVRVTNRSNGRSVVVTINDRGPFVGGRVIDLSRGAARVINMTGAGVAPVSIEVLGRG